MRTIGVLVLRGQRHSARIVPLFSMVAHANEHYGNLVTYMRLKGIGRRRPSAHSGAHSRRAGARSGRAGHLRCDRAIRSSRPEARERRRR